MTEDERAAHELLRRRQRDYKLALNQPAVQAMLTDLAAFCRAVRLTDEDVKDPTRLAILVGRQQVWERIQHNFHLSTDQLYALYTGHQVVVSEDDNVSA